MASLGSLGSAAGASPPALLTRLSGLEDAVGAAGREGLTVRQRVAAGAPRLESIWDKPAADLDALLANAFLRQGNAAVCVAQSPCVQQDAATGQKTVGIVRADGTVVAHAQAGLGGFTHFLPGVGAPGYTKPTTAGVAELSFVLAAPPNVNISVLRVSLRGVYRDHQVNLDALAMAGVPVYSMQGRGGGWRLVGGARTDLSGLTASEARALFLVALQAHVKYIVLAAWGRIEV